MKKIVALGAIAALACGMAFADEPAIDIKVAEFSGNAQVKWGVDLDAGQHGFDNSTESKLKVNLWNEGTKETTADDGNGFMWAEIQVKGKAANIENGALKDGTASLEKATLHIGENFYVNIKSGDLKVGEYKPDTAIHGDYAYLANKGWDWDQGIEAGWDASAFKFSLGFRSMAAKKTKYTSAYGFKLAAELKDGDDALVPGLSAVAGFGMNLSTDYKDCADPTVKMPDDFTKDGKPVEAGKDNVADHAAAILSWDSPAKNTDHSVMTLDKKPLKNAHDMYYGIKAAYKLSIDDTLYVKPSVGFAGRYVTATKDKGTFGLAEDKAYTFNDNDLAFGVLFGWGAQADANAGVPFLDADSAKKVTPGVSVAAYIPLPSTSTTGDKKTVTYGALKTLIVPSIYSGDIEAGPGKLTAAAYSEIGLYSYIENASDKDKTEGNTRTVKGSAMKSETFAFALAAGVKYAVTLDNDATVTPKAGFRYVNGAYIGNKLPGTASDIFKTGLGLQSKAVKDAAKDKTYAADFFNLKIGCDFAGFINNTTFSVNYNSANLLNAIGTEESWPAYDKDTKYYNVKAGQLDVGCKISL